MDQLFASVSKDLEVAHLGLVLVHLAAAVFLGALVAYRPWRRFLAQPAPLREMAHAQILIALAGALAVTVVGDSLARAFGLVGLGGFIRFRTGIRDPRDAAVFFLLIGLGMACGLGAIGLACAGAGLVCAVVFLLDLSQRDRGHLYVRISAACKDPIGASRPIRAVIEGFPVFIRNITVRLEQREVRFDLENPSGVDPTEIQAAVVEALSSEITALACESLDSLKGAKL